jgi:RNA recognition motif-containing protein
MFTSLKISNLPPVVSKSDIEGMFSMIGNVREAKIVYDENTGLSLGVAIVEMSTEEEAQDCILHYNGKNLDGKTIFVRANAPHVPDPLKKQISKKSSSTSKKGKSK